jgi:hypothetical protein
MFTKKVPRHRDQPSFRGTAARRALLLLFALTILSKAELAFSQSAQATLSQQAPEPAPVEEAASGPRAGAGATFDTSWICEGFAAAPEPWMTADAELRLVLDGNQVLSSRVFSANYWGATYQVSGTAGAVDYIRTISCEINVSCSGCNSVSAGDSEEIYPELSPNVSVGSDSQNWWWNDMWRRDIWYQIKHFNGIAWTRGGQVTEQFFVLSNPCGMAIQQGSSPVNGSGQFLDTYFADIEDPGCTAVADQHYRLSTAGASSILEQRWRWDNTGIWRQ